MTDKEQAVGAADGLLLVAAHHLGTTPTKKRQLRPGWPGRPQRVQRLSAEIAEELTAAWSHAPKLATLTACAPRFDF